MANIGIIPYEEKGDIGNKKPEDLSKCKLVSKGDLVINSMNYGIGSYGISKLSGVCSPVYIVLRPRLDRIRARFAFRIFENRAFQTFVQSFGNGILEHRAAINWDILKSINVGVPPVEEQEAILDFLDRETAKIDTLIAEQEKLIVLLAEKRQATISHAVTRGLNPNAPMKDSGVPWLGDVPAHWEVIPLKHLVDLRSGGTPSKENMDYWNGEVPWASAKDLKVEQLSSTGDRISQKALADGAANLVPQGAVLVVVRGMILARMFPVVETLVPMAINQDLKAVLPRNKLGTSFLAWLLRGSADESLQRLDEAGHGTKALRMDAWTSMKLPVPPLAEQVCVVNFILEEVARLDALRVRAEEAIALLKERRSALIAAAVTGKIDVRGQVENIAI
ncbi:restriction endonuclease subunit S [Xanthomonas translucens]|uniref:restriction endonuclease subunit S n=1 Tax=Xanthomonas campestris pv. translucens TaxID=343 RepID=UPI001F01B82A|nr:restriction endonuclease subunit S [Xanthomonas translucens]UKE49961.1 restriction endonuclease subunit S [Xanthomonas translucens]